MSPGDRPTKQELETAAAEAIIAARAWNRAKRAIEAWTDAHPTESVRNAPGWPEYERAHRHLMHWVRSCGTGD